MNVNDSDIVRSLLLDAGWKEVDTEAAADLLLTNTCAIRDGAENRVWQRLRELQSLRGKKKKKRSKKVVTGVLGCMAERLKEDLLESGLADLVVGPDAYRDVPRLCGDLLSEESDRAISVQLSLEETYADITPVRRHAADVSAFVSIQRGCNNRCSFCIVPFTRGVERSRPAASVVEEVRRLHEEGGIKEVTLLGQNVNSYHDLSEAAVESRPSSQYTLSNEGFRSRIRRSEGGYFFADLLEAVADVSPELRVRFTSPHPKDYPAELLSLMAERPNVCNHVHMPAQSGSSAVLKRMKRGYTREAYLQLIDDVRTAIPDVAISSDFITGFCGETESDHDDTVRLMEQVRYDQAYMFAYSEREKTHAARTMEDDVPEKVKQRRLREIIDTFHRTVHEKNVQQEVGRLRLVLTEGESKRSKEGARSWHGRTDQNKRILWTVDDEEEVSCWNDREVETAIRAVQSGSVTLISDINNSRSPLVPNHKSGRLDKGDYAVVRVTEAKGHTLRGKLLWKTSLTSWSETGLAVTDAASLERAQVLQRILLSEDTVEEELLERAS
jgi:MiaB/RimO family radical SAM methylthiotransferase